MFSVDYLLIADCIEVGIDSLLLLHPIFSGPSKITASLLKKLKSEGVSATFFVNGKNGKSDEHFRAD